MPTATAEAELTVTRTGVELVSVGTWDASTGKARITQNDLKAMVDAYANPHHDAMPVKIGHDDDRFQDADGNPPSTRDGEPAYGWIENLRLSEDGKTLIGDLIGVPKMLADVMDTALRRRSVELTRHERVGGKVYPAVLNAVSLLGVQAPAVKGLADLRALFAGQLAQQPERFSVEVGAQINDDTPVIPQSQDQNPQRDAEQHAHDNGNSEGETIVALNAMQKKALGIAENATPEEIAAALKKMGLRQLSEGEENDGTTVEQTNQTPAAAPAATTQTPAPATPAAPAVAPLPAQAPAAVATTDNTQITDTTSAEPLTPQAVAAAASTVGLQVVDRVMFAQLQQDAAAGRQARDEQDRTRRDALVQDAVRKGKIAPGAFQAFRKQADTDESGLITLLAAMPEILPTVQVGHGEQFTGADPGSDRQSVDATAAVQKRASVYAHFGIPVPTEK